MGGAKTWRSSQTLGKISRTTVCCLIMTKIKNEAISSKVQAVSVALKLNFFWVVTVVIQYKIKQ